MSNKSPSRRAIAFMVIGFGLIAMGIAAMAFITLNPNSILQGDTVQPITVNYPVPALTLNDVDGNQHSLGDYRGQVMLVNMWATWCPPCRAEMPTLEAFYRDHANDGFVMIGINDGETLDLVTPFVSEYGLSFPIWLDPTYRSETAFETINLPSSFVIDRQGRVRLQWVGEINRTMLDKYVVSIISEK
jgi:thiol-disulfide isomerase/thioredoxin